MAVCRAGCFVKSIPLYRHIADLNGYEDVYVPVPVVSLMMGGSSASNPNNKLTFEVIVVIVVLQNYIWYCACLYFWCFCFVLQELVITPSGASTFSEAILLVQRVSCRVRDMIIGRDGAITRSEVSCI